MARNSEQGELGATIWALLLFGAAFAMAFIIAIAIERVFAFHLESWAVLGIMLIFYGAFALIDQRRVIARIATECVEKLFRHIDRVVALSTSEAAREATILLADETCFKRTPVSGCGTPLPAGTPDTVSRLLESTERIEGIDVELVIERQAVQFRNSVELQIGAWTSADGDSYSITVNVQTGEALLYCDAEDPFKDSSDDSDADSEEESAEDPDEKWPSLYHLIVMHGGMSKLDG